MDNKSKIESLLFISGNPFSLEKVAGLAGIKKEEAESLLNELKKDYEDGKGGLRIVVVENK